MLHCVITTIQEPTDSVFTLAKRLVGFESHLVIAGDTKGPARFDLSSIEGFGSEQLTFLSIESQLESEFEVAKLLPVKHYCRKNVGYLHAMKNGASCIYETDDDNAPLETWKPRKEWIEDAVEVGGAQSEGTKWVNVYRKFSSENIWPRGLPLDQIHSPMKDIGKSERLWAPVQQGLADGSPDVDAIWRLVLDREFKFDDGPSVFLGEGQWCPFNTQTTWWWPAAYPLMYVPSYCSFRMCDIWKSFVAQRCLWALDTGVVFHAPEVWQERNLHNLMRDFDDEIPGYQLNDRLVSILENLNLLSGTGNVASNLQRCYQALVSEGIFPEQELKLVDAWIADVAAIV